MSNYRRLKITGAWYFFTVVTYKRRPFLTDETARAVLKEAFRNVQSEMPFEIAAFCLLPDHLHCIWKLPSGDYDYSVRWGRIKRLFSKCYIAAGGRPSSQTISRVKKREFGIWQRRFWEHRIRDQDDYWNHVHYIHYNPVRHGLVERVADWPYSSYHRFFQQGLYKDFDWMLFRIEKTDSLRGYNE